MKVAVLISACGQKEREAECISQVNRQIDLLASDGNFTFEIFTDGSYPGDYDFYLKLDSRLTLKDGSFASLLENSSFLRHRAIVVGTVGAEDGTLVYGGRTRFGEIIEPDPTIPVPCHNFDGNLVLIPRAAYDKIGMMGDDSEDGANDYDYSIKALEAGIYRVIAPSVLAGGERADGEPEWLGSPVKRILHRMLIKLKTIFK